MFCLELNIIEALCAKDFALGLKNSVNSVRNIGINAGRSMATARNQANN